MTVRKIDYPNSGGKGTGSNPRIESGAVQFGEDWKGLFLRGDECIVLATNIDAILNEDCDEGMKWIAKQYLEGLVKTIVEDVLS